LALPRGAKAGPTAALDEVHTISHRANLYHGWPTLARRRCGQLLLVYSGGREAHVCPFGRVEMMRSDDDGQTWSWPRVLLDTAIDDRDAGVLETADGTILVLTDRRRHCETLCALLRYRHGLTAEKLTGDMPDAERRALLERLEAGKVAVIVATGQLMGEGFDSRRLTTLFLATPIRFSGRVLQYLGRILRPAPGKKKAKVYDYVDARVEVLAAAARARRRVYEGGGGGARSEV